MKTTPFPKPLLSTTTSLPQSTRTCVPVYSVVADTAGVKGAAAEERTDEEEEEVAAAAVMAGPPPSVTGVQHNHGTVLNIPQTANRNAQLAVIALLGGTVVWLPDSLSAAGKRHPSASKGHNSTRLRYCDTPCRTRQYQPPRRPSVLPRGSG